MQLILSQHDCKCATCVRSGNCSLQKIANDLNILELPFGERIERQPWNKDFPLIRDSANVSNVCAVSRSCDKVQSLHIWIWKEPAPALQSMYQAARKIEEADCSLCGQCITHCPVGALRERDDTEKVWDAIADKNTITVAQIAPAVRTAWGEALGLSREDATVNKIADALHKIGVDYVFDTSFSARSYDHGEGNEFLERSY